MVMDLVVVTIAFAVPLTSRDSPGCVKGLGESLKVEKTGRKRGNYIFSPTGAGLIEYTD